MFQDSDSDNRVEMAKSDRLSPILLAMGSNLSSWAGPPDATVRESLSELTDSGLEVVSVSQLYRTPAVPLGSGPDFVNAAVRCKSSRSPGEILGILHKIEEKFGRQRKNRWGARTLDLDFIAFGDLVLPDKKTHTLWRKLTLDEQKTKAPDGLILPHPRLQERAFVLIPLTDVATDWIHPILGKSAVELLEDLPQDQLKGIVPI